MDHPAKVILGLSMKQDTPTWDSEDLPQEDDAGPIVISEEHERKGTSKLVNPNAEEQPWPHDDDSHHNAPRPGAVHIPGNSRRGISTRTSTVELEDPTSPQPTSTGQGNSLRSLQDTSPPIELEAYPVLEGDDQVEKHRHDYDKPLVPATLDHRRRYILALIAIIVIVVALAVGVVASQLKDSENSGPDKDVDAPLLLVTFLYNSKVDGTFIEGRQFRTIEGSKEVVTTKGNSVEAECVVGPCKDEPGACQVSTEEYKEGCCFGVECPEESKCGEACYPGACKPKFDGCVSPECYSCAKGPNGEDLYRMRDTTANIVCIKYGTSQTPQGGLYDWVIFCSEIIHGGHEESNFATGEYYCQSLRKGDVMNMTLSHQVPCQYIQLGECGCGPANMYPFDLDPPEKACETVDDCSFLCSDVPNADPQDLCNAFNIGWWEGQNWMGDNTFYNPWIHSDADFDIVIFNRE